MASIRLAIPAPKTAPPAATVRSAAVISAAVAPLRTYPRAPAASAANTLSSSSTMEITSTAVAGAIWVMRRVASTPEAPGRLMSMSTTSGMVSLRTASASSAVPAVPATSTSGRVASSPARPSRNTG